MPSFNRVSKGFDIARKEASKSVNWHPGHMFSGMQAMIGKLNTVDCVIEVHDARIPTIGRNQEFRQHLGAIKPHILVLNKRDLADLTKWDIVKEKLHEYGDHNVILSDMSGGRFSHADKGYDTILEKAVSLIRERDRHNRSHLNEFKIMIVGIPNVGKSTLVNRLRQHYLGAKGEANRTGNMAGVTRRVEERVKVCAKPLIYSIDTPGVLQPSATRDKRRSMMLALCSTINDRALNSHDLATFLLGYLNNEQNYTYTYQLNIESPAANVAQLCQDVAAANYPNYNVKSHQGKVTELLDNEKICWKFVNLFRNGMFGKVMFY